MADNFSSSTSPQGSKTKKRENIAEKNNSINLDESLDKELSVFTKPSLIFDKLKVRYLKSQEKSVKSLILQKDEEELCNIQIPIPMKSRKNNNLLSVLILARLLNK